ncbi:MAG: HAMP domain-containing histidine kinase [Planctomycetes bacterium]|nr:HAMP domain-containing histidine kinase [Planctomycetota bacterium]
MTRTFLGLLALMCVAILATTLVLQQLNASWNAKAEADATAERNNAMASFDVRQLVALEELQVARRQRIAERWREDIHTHGALLPSAVVLALEASLLVGQRQDAEADAASTKALLGSLDEARRLALNSATGTHESETRELLLTVALCMLLSAAGLWLWWHATVQRPLQQLALRAGASGSINPAEQDSALTRELARALHSVLADLGRAQSELEQRVDDKTRQLGAALDVQREQSHKLSELLAALQSAKEQLVRHEKLAAVGTLAAGVAHEFNNIIGGIRGCASEAAAERPPLPVQECLDMILRASERGRAIVLGLGQLGRPRRTESEVCAGAEVLADVVHMLKQQADDAGVQICVEGAPAFAVAAPAGVLQQMLLNLVRNALQASPRAGSVTIRVASDQGRVRMSVLDCGAGVAPELRARLFEPFFTTRERTGGTGLGLAITHGLAIECGGSTGYAPREDAGSVFWCELPCAGANA